MEAITLPKAKTADALVNPKDFIKKPQTVSYGWENIKTKKITDSEFNLLAEKLIRIPIYKRFEKISSTPKVLQPLYDQIQDAKEILSYEDNWDDDGGLATNQATFDKACDFVLDYAIKIYDKFSVALKAPYIDIMPDGSISVFWEEESAQLLIIFKKDNFELAHYYAESTDRKIPFKSAIEPDGEADEILITWMKQNLT